MYYVEFLRVLRTLRLVGYVCGAFLLLALVLRPFSHGGFNEPNTIAGVDPSTVTAQVNADGTSTKTFVGRKGAKITITTAKDGVQTVTVDEPVTPANARKSANIEVGGRLRVHAFNTAGRHIVTTTNDPHIPVFILLLIAAGAAGIVATMLGLALSKENDGHLELAWTKPASREVYALGSIAMDVAGVILAAGAVFLTTIVVLAIYGGMPYLQWDSRVMETAVFAILFALSFYGIVLAATSSMSRGGLVLALVWPAALILPGLVSISWMSVGTVARTLNTINPVAYFYAFSTSPEATHFYTLLPNYGTAIQLLALVALFAIGLVLSLMQWRRLEA